MSWSRKRAVYDTLKDMTREELVALRTAIANAEEQRIITTLHESLGISVSALAEAAHVGRPTVGERLRQMALRGRVEQDATGQWRLKRKAPRPEPYRRRRRAVASPEPRAHGSGRSSCPCSGGLLLKLGAFDFCDETT
jgi:DNA-binding MarR family transcriptional regulator